MGSHLACLLVLKMRLSAFGILADQSLLTSAKFNHHKTDLSGVLMLCILLIRTVISLCGFVFGIRYVYLPNSGSGKQALRG